MRRSLPRLFTYLVLSIWSLIVLFPIWTLLVDSLKTQKDIFKDPFGLPPHPTLVGYQAVLNTGQFGLYFFNTIYVTAVSLFCILFF